MKYPVRHLLLVLLVACYSLAEGQHHHCLHYTLNDGLPSNTINDIHQDESGYLWLATPSGLTRFNGRTFKLFSSREFQDVRRPKLLAPLWEHQLAVATKNNNLYRFKNGNFQLIMPGSLIEQNEITALHYHNEHNSLFVGTIEGFAIIQKDTLPEFLSSSKKILPKPFHVVGFQSNEKGVYVFTLMSGVYLFDIHNNKIQKITHKQLPPNPHISSTMISDWGDTLWAIANRGIYNLDQDLSITHKLQGKVHHLTEGTDGSFWFTNNKTPLDKKQAFIYKSTENTTKNMTDALFHDAVEFSALHFDDREQKLWMGTQQKGLYGFVGNQFTYYPYHAKGSIKDIAIQNEFLALLTDEELLVLRNSEKEQRIARSHFDSLFQSFKDNHLEVKYYYLNDPTGSYSKYERLRKKKVYPYLNPYQPNDEKGAFYKPHLWEVLKEKQLESFTNLGVDSSGNFIIGTNTGIFTYAPISQELAYQDFPDNFFTHHYIDSTGKQVSFSWKEISLYEQSGLRKRTLQNYLDNNIPEKVSESYQTDSSLLLFSISDGLYNLTDDTCQVLMPADTIKKYGITTFATQANGPMLFGTETGEVLIYEMRPTGLTRLHYLRAHETIPADNILWLKCKSNDIVWLGTNKGLLKLDLSTLHLPNKQQGIQLLTCSEGFCDVSGKKAISTPRGLLIASDKQLICVNTQKKTPLHRGRGELLFESIHTNGIPLDKQLIQNNINNDTVLHFGAKENSLTFSFDLVQYRSVAPDFEYRLLGINEQWTLLHQAQKIVYSELPPGNYKFQLRVAGAPQITPLLFAFSIRPPFYSTWYFLTVIGTLLLIMVIAIVWFIIRKIKRQEKRKGEIQERIAEFEIKALRAQMNPHFIFNAINSIQNFMLDNDIDSALAYLSDFAKLIRTTLDNASQKFVELDEEIAYLRYYLSLEQMRFDNKFSVHMHRAEDLNQKKVIVPPMIIQPYVENAIKHGLVHKTEGRGELTISFRLENKDTLVCVVEDNGIGRKRALEINRKRPGMHKPKGSKITEERIQLLNQMYPYKSFHVEITDLYDNYAKPAGTRAEIRFPLLEADTTSKQ